MNMKNTSQIHLLWISIIRTRDDRKIPIRKDDRKILRATLCYLFGAIWKEINKMVFKDEQFSLSRVKKNFVYSLCS